MPIDPALERMTQAIAAAGCGALMAGDPEEARERGRRARAQFYPPVWFEVGSVEDLVLDGPAAGIAGRVYRPATGPVGTVVYFHGGGFMIGDLDSHDGHCRRIAATASAVVVAVDYRLAPENRFPAAFDDAWAATRWVAERLAASGGVGNPLAVAGDSAGGNLAAAVALACRDAGIPLAGQMLLYPAVSLGEVPHADDDAETAEQRYLGDISRASDWRASPAMADSHVGVAQAIIGVGEYDFLRAQSLDYGRILRAAGVPVLLRDYPGLDHGFFCHGSVSQAAEQAADELTRDLAALFAESGEPPCCGGLNSGAFPARGSWPSART